MPSNREGWQGPAQPIDHAGLFRAMPVMCAILAADAPRFTLLEVTDAYCAAAHKSREELLGQGLFEAFPDEAPESDDAPSRRVETALRESLATVCRTRMAHRMETFRYDMPTSAGALTPQYWQPFNVPIVGPTGEIDCILNQVEDVTTKQANEEFQREMTGHLASFNAELTYNAEQRDTLLAQLEHEHEALERRVTIRTAELADLNAALQMALAERERSERDRNELLRLLANAQEEERRRLSRELHDEVGQHLAALGLGLRTMSDLAPAGSELAGRAAQLREMASSLGRELHSLAVRLRPRALDDFGLEAALTSYADEWSRQHGIQLDVHTRLEDTRLPSAMESAVYRIAQEALTNVARHSDASRASLVVERRHGHLHLIVEDDGRGFDSSNLRGSVGGQTGLGLLGIRERAALVGGTMEIESARSGGTSIFVRLPIESGEPISPPAAEDDR